MSTIALDYLIELGLIKKSGKYVNSEKIPAETLSDIIECYRHLILDAYTSGKTPQGSVNSLNGLFSSVSTNVSQESLLSSCLVYDRVIIDDPLLIHHGIDKNKINEALTFYSVNYELIRAGLIITVPLTAINNPNNEYPILHSDDAFRSCIPESIHDFIHASAVQKSVIQGENNQLYILSEDASIHRRMALHIQFKKDICKNSPSLYLFQTSSFEETTDKDFLKMRTSWDPNGRLDEEKFRFWAYQTINQLMRVRLIKIQNEIDLADRYGYTYITESDFESNLLNMAINKDFNSGFAAKHFLEANNLTFISIPEDLLRLRTNNPILFERFNSCLINISHELKFLDEHEFIHRSKRLFETEIRPQIDEINQTITSIRTGFTKGTAVSLVSFMASILTGSYVPVVSILGLSVANGLAETLSEAAKYQNLKKTPAFIWHKLAKI